MKHTLIGLIRLSRFKEYLFFVIVTTFIGAITAGGQFGWPLVLVLLANWLAVGFAFMINDVEDAPDDALHSAKAQRNPVSAGLLTSRWANGASLAVAVLALACYALVGWVPLALGATCVLTGFLYSWRRVRLKTIAPLDLISHAFMLAGLQYLCAFFTFQRSFTPAMIFPFIFLFAISLYGELYNELRDLDVDTRAGLRHTAITLGKKRTNILMNTLLAVGVAAGAYTFFIQRLLPPWVLVVLAVLAALFITPGLLKLRRRHAGLQVHEPFQKPLEIAAAFSLVIQMVVPWVSNLLHLRWF